MSSTDAEARKLVEHVKSMFGDQYETLSFPSPEAALSAKRYRNRLVERISTGTEPFCGGTKFASGNLSTGCSLCVEGAWTCLFVNGVCDAGCFFCPKTKDPEAIPTADGIPFSDVAEFVAYVGKMGSRGVGISGGEPLMSMERTLEFIAGIKGEFRDTVHIWLYTSGLHATDANLRELAAAGLDEIRFNIAANGYRTDPLRNAARHIQSVVVEIPVVPEDTKLLVGLLPALADLGVGCVNLHQMWCSPTNVPALVGRGYTFQHGSLVAVLESETAALEVLEHAAFSSPGVPVHYCSSAFKQRYQTAAALRRDARLVARGHEEITEAGLIRVLSVSGPKEALVEQCRRIEAAGATSTEYSLDEKESRLFFKASAWDSMDFQTFPPRLSYDLVFRPPPEEPDESVVEIPISAEMHVRLKRSPVEIVPAMSKADLRWFRERVGRGEVSVDPTGPSTRFDVYEGIEVGLPRYY